ncbi:DMT family transporter [Alcaligenaceae bacterium 429]|uniref:DMT family transporter n=1 Tax=Paenalcaligenes sp. Me52 TaxID=3392038 RepID=UPI001093121C|nr:DMT family transporter [Alcaligenaceae bacterium 429]
MNASLYHALLLGAALIAGAVVPFQSGSNALLGRMLGHPLWATVTSLCVSLLAVIPLLLLFRAPFPKIEQALQAPFWVWTGGLSGVIFITAALLITPRLGATGFMISAIAGQILIAMLIDHFGLMGLPIKEVNLGRVIGVVMIFAGVMVVQRFTP